MQRFIRIDGHVRTDRYRLPADAVVDLEILRGDARQRVRRVDVPVFLIGTAGDCDLVLVEETIPEVHTYLYVRPEGVSIRTLGAGPPLVVDGRVVENAMLADGDDFSIGPFEFLVRIGRSGDPSRKGDWRLCACRRQNTPGDRPPGDPAADSLPPDAVLDAVRQSLLVRGLRLYVEPLAQKPIAQTFEIPSGRASA